MVTEPRSGRSMPEQEPHQRGLPGTVQADQRVDLAGKDLKIDVIDRTIGHRTIGLGLRHGARRRDR